MKTKSIMAGMLSMLVLAAGCNKNEVIGTGVSEGEPTYAAISVSVSAPGTRAVTGNNTYDDLEKEINNLYIYVFDNTGKYEGQFDNTALVNNTNTYLLATTTGSKTIFALANWNGTTIPTFGTLDECKNYTVNSTNIVSQAFSFTMTGVGAGVVSQKFATQEDAENAVRNGTIDKVNIKVSRLAAKVQVALGKNISCEPSMDAHVCVNDMAQPEFTIGNEVPSMYTYPETKNSERTNIHGLRNYWTAVSIDGTFDYSCDNSQYLTENYGSTPVASEASYVLVSATIHPNYITAADGTKTLLGEDAHNTTFYTIANYDPQSASVSHYAEADEDGQMAILYFASEADATTYAKNKDITFVSGNITGYRLMEFDGGKSYYRIYLGEYDGQDNKIYNVIRNHYYKVSINSVNSLGVSTPNETIPQSPNLPIELTTYVGVTITVEDWFSVDFPSVLG